MLNFSDIFSGFIFYWQGLYSFLKTYIHQLKIKNLHLINIPVKLFIWLADSCSKPNGLLGIYK